MLEKKGLSNEQIVALSNISKGDRLILVNMDDEHAPYPFTRGTVNCIDDNLTIHTNWDNGQCLGLILGVDSFYIIPKEVTQLENYYKTNKGFKKFFNKYCSVNKLYEWLSTFDFHYIGPVLNKIDEDVLEKIIKNDYIWGDFNEIVKVY